MPDRSGRRVVEPGELRVWVGTSGDDPGTTTPVDLTGEVHAVTPGDESGLHETVTDAGGTGGVHFHPSG